MTSCSSALLEVWQLTMFQLLDGAPEVCGNQNTLLKACSTELGNVIFADPDKGDTVVVLDSLFSVTINNVSALFWKGRNYKYDGEADLGLRQVCPTDDTIIFEAPLLSRKVMLFARNENDDEQEDNFTDGQCFILMDYMRRVFPFTEGTVVVPYYPVVHNMVEIK